MLFNFNSFSHFAKMDASFHFMRWSLVQECLATADFSSSTFSQLVLCSLRRIKCEISASFTNIYQTTFTWNAVHTGFLKFINLIILMCTERSKQLVFLFSRNLLKLSIAFIVVIQFVMSRRNGRTSFMNNLETKLSAPKLVIACKDNK